MSVRAMDSSTQRVSPVKQALVGSTQIAFDYGYQDFGILKNIQKFTVGIIF